MADTDHTAPPGPPPGPAPALGDGGAPGPPGGPGDDLGPDSGDHRGPPRFTRRQVLTLAGAGGLVGAGLLANRWIDDSPVADRRPTGSDTPSTDAPATSAPEAPAPPSIALWSDPATWGGQVPGPADVAGVTQPVLLDVDAQVAGVQIAEGGELVFDPAASRTLTSTGNVVVAGALRARPSSAAVRHLVAFAGIDESRFVGSHTMAPLDSDVGLWVVGNGVLDLVGTPKKAWSNLASGAGAGDTTITVADASGWLPGDELVVTPTESTEAEGFAEHHDRRIVQSVDGARVTLDRPLSYAHPAVTVREGVTHTAEVLNLTRNVAVEGTPEGRAHVILLDIKAPQTISHVGLRHLGPQQAWTGDEGETGIQGVKGRYSLHFHMSYDATRGSVVDSVVAYDGGNHSFVPHLSHGITFRDCVAHDQAQSAYWWDPAEGAQEGDAVPTHDLLYERCVASHITTTDATEYETSGFVMGAGNGNVARGCVTVGLLGSDESTPGYGWHPASAGGVWTFEDNLSHNSDGSAIYFWINNTPPTLVDRFTGYQNVHGIHAGSYTNLVSYRDTTVYACAERGILVVAVPGAPEEQPDLTITYENIYVDQAGLTEYAFEIGGHVVDTTSVTRVIGSEFKGGTVAQVGFPEADVYPQLYEFTDCSYDGTAFYLADDLTEVVDIRVRDAVHGDIALYPAGHGGEQRPEWNAAVTAA
jgi:hypothetical protein